MNQGKTTTGVTSSSNPSTTGQPVTFTATVSVVSPATGTLTGSVTFAGVNCDGGNIVPVAGGLAQCIITEGLIGRRFAVPRDRHLRLRPELRRQHGDKVMQVVSAGGATVTLASSPNTCNGDICTTSQGTPLTFTATVSAESGTPTGPVDFTIIPAGKKAKRGLTCDGGNTRAAQRWTGLLHVSPTGCRPPSTTR